MKKFDYDSWLEQPYQEMCERQEMFDNAAEHIIDEYGIEYWNELTSKEQERKVSEYYEEDYYE